MLTGLTELNIALPSRAPLIVSSAIRTNMWRRHRFLSSALLGHRHAANHDGLLLQPRSWTSWLSTSPCTNRASRTANWCRLGIRETVIRRMLDPNHATKPEKLQAALAELGQVLAVSVVAT
jgi:hypothetical protein